jgi:hypothetical protein
MHARPFCFELLLNRATSPWTLCLHPSTFLYREPEISNLFHEYQELGINLVISI